MNEYKLGGSLVNNNNFFPCDTSYLYDVYIVLIRFTVKNEKYFMCS